MRLLANCQCEKQASQSLHYWLGVSYTYFLLSLLLSQLSISMVYEDDQCSKPLRFYWKNSYNDSFYQSLPQLSWYIIWLGSRTLLLVSFVRESVALYSYYTLAFSIQSCWMAYSQPLLYDLPLDEQGMHTDYTFIILTEYEFLGSGEAGLAIYYEDVSATSFTLILYTFYSFLPFYLRQLSTLNYATCISILIDEWKFSTFTLFYDVPIPDILFKLSMGVDGDSSCLEPSTFGELLRVLALIFCKGESICECLSFYVYSSTDFIIFTLCYTFSFFFISLSIYSDAFSFTFSQLCLLLLSYSIDSGVDTFQQWNYDMLFRFC